MGRDLYIREGCVGCHSQMIRPFRSETERYGEYSKAGEFVYDHPFLWGSKRTGPGPAPRGRQVSRRLALQAHGGPAIHLARIDHAALPVAADPEAQHQRDAEEDHGVAQSSACPIQMASKTPRWLK
jgi:hypothetical protein